MNFKVEQIVHDHVVVLELIKIYERKVFVGQFYVHALHTHVNNTYINCFIEEMIEIVSIRLVYKILSKQETTGITNNSEITSKQTS